MCDRIERRKQLGEALSQADPVNTITVHQDAIPYKNRPLLDRYFLHSSIALMKRGLALGHGLLLSHCTFTTIALTLPSPPARLAASTSVRTSFCGSPSCLCARISARRSSCSIDQRPSVQSKI